jgi:sugar phosphate isomerase/epimerase
MTNRKNWLPSASTCWDTLGAEMYRSLAEEGIHHVELSGGNVRFFEELDFVRTAPQVIAEMRACDVEPSSIHLPFAPFETMDPTSPDDGVRDRIVETQGELLHAAADVGIPIAVIHPSGEPYRAFERGERMRRCIDTLGRIAEIASDCGVRLAVENLPRTCLGNIHEEIRLMVSEIPSLYVCFDTNHSLRQSNVDFVRALGDRIITIHASDYDMIDERHLLPFLGRNDWNGILTAMEETDYSGFFTFEVSCKGVLTARSLRLAYDKLMHLNEKGNDRDGE